MQIKLRQLKCLQSNMLWCYLINSSPYTHSEKFSDENFVTDIVSDVQRNCSWVSRWCSVLRYWLCNSLKFWSVPPLKLYYLSTNYILTLFFHLNPPRHFPKHLLSKEESLFCREMLTMLHYQLAAIRDALKCASYFVNSLKTMHKKYLRFVEEIILTIVISLKYMSNKDANYSYLAGIVDFVTTL